MMTVTVGVKDSYDEYFYIDADSYSERVHALWGYTEDEAAAEQMLAVMYETASGEKLTDSQISLCMDFGKRIINLPKSVIWKFIRPSQTARIIPCLSDRCSQ